VGQCKLYGWPQTVRLGAEVARPNTVTEYDAVTGGEKLRSWSAPWYKHRFDARERKAYGPEKKTRVETFVLATREWSEAWETSAMRTVFEALSDCGLTRLQMLKWRQRKWLLGVEWVPEVLAEGQDAETRLFQAIHEDSDPSGGDTPATGDSWGEALFKWSSADQATTVLAFKKLGESEDVGDVWPPGYWFEGRGEFLQTIGFFIWGQDASGVLRVMESAVQATEDSFFGHGAS
jgi:hypothetical protein